MLYDTAYYTIYQTMSYVRYTMQCIALSYTEIYHTLLYCTMLHYTSVICAVMYMSLCYYTLANIVSYCLMAR